MDDINCAQSILKANLSIKNDLIWSDTLSKPCSICCYFLKVCLTILRRYGLKGLGLRGNLLVQVGHDAYIGFLLLDRIISEF